MTGADVALLGAGDDLFLWNHGDGNDVIEGQGGFDTLRVTGFTANENFDIAANGGRVALTRTSSRPSRHGRCRAAAGAGAGRSGFDCRQRPSGTDVTDVAIDLAATTGGKVAG